jgi:hypothetical protein
VWTANLTGPENGTTEIVECAMNRWNIPPWLEQEILARDTACVYCGVEFSFPATGHGTRPSWEHIINDATIVTRENIARCCISCNASKGTKDIEAWVSSKYCQRKGISKNTVAQVVRNAIVSRRREVCAVPGPPLAAQK